MRASNSPNSRFNSKASSVRLLNMLSALRELTPFNSLTADEEVLLDELIVHWHRTDNLTISDVMVGTRRASSSTNYRRLIRLRDKGFVKLRPDLQDKRVKFVEPTARARDYMDQLSNNLNALLLGEPRD